MRNPGRTAISASVAALAAVFVAQTSPAAADDCLAAPKGAAPSGQHWYYHLDKTSKRKCWYLHEATAKTAPAARSPGAARPGAPAENGPSAERTSAPRDASAQPSGGASNGNPNPSRSDPAAGAITAPASANTITAPPLQPASEPMAAQGAAAPWGAPSAPAPADVQRGPATPDDTPVNAASTPTDTSAATTPDAVARPDGGPVTTSTPANPSPHSVVQDLLIIALAAGLAGALSITIAVIRRRKPVTATLGNFIEWAAGLVDTALAKLAALRRRKPAAPTPAARSSAADMRPHRQSPGRPRPPSREDNSLRPAPTQQPSLIPEQLTMARPFVAPRGQARIHRDRPARVE